MTAGDSSDKRQHVRVKFSGDLTIYHVQPSKSGYIFEVQEKPISAKLDDVSEAGLKLEIGDTKLATDILKVNFNVKKSEPVNAFAKMVWKNGNCCGLQFIMLDEDSRKRIKNYISKQK